MAPKNDHAEPRDGRYRRLEEYGAIGDLSAFALVGSDGSIDWYCHPHMGAASVFGAILDVEKGGTFRIGSVGERNCKQIYFPETNVLITRFLGADSVGEVVDFMPMDLRDEHGHPSRIVRRVHAIRGGMDFEMRCLPAFDYGRAAHGTSRVDEGVEFESTAGKLLLASSTPIEATEREARATFHLAPRQTATFILTGLEGDAPRCCLDAASAERMFHATVRFWRRWSSKCTYVGRWREQVIRSALVLKLLSYRPTGAVMAAGTTSLPEHIGGHRNWDYRFTFLRDAGFTLYGLGRIGLFEETEAFMHWLHERAEESEGSGLQPLYGIDGAREVGESVLDHWEGYETSRPVRIGNKASDQLQLDIYGELLDAVYFYNKHSSPISSDLWASIRSMMDWLAGHWREPDRGIWEMRSPPRQFVYSKVMCWVAFDRAIRIADNRGYPADLDKWRRERDAVYTEVMEKGWNAELQSFVMEYGGDELDAALLLMPLVFFLAPKEERMLKTIDAIQNRLAEDNLVFRYKTNFVDDGVGGNEGAFTMCSFWLVEALTMAGRLDEARLMFEKMLGYANPLGLFAEEISPSGRLLGNFPQALTHLSLISAAFNLDRALGSGE